MLPNEKTTRSEIGAEPDEVEALVVAAGRDAARPLVDFLRGEAFNVSLIEDADSAFEEALLHRPNVVLIDDRIPPAGGIELCQRLKGNTRTHFVPALLCMASDVRESRLRALAAGADAVFGPATDAQERRTRLWALLKTEAIHRRQDKRHRRDGTALDLRRRWLRGWARELEAALGEVEGDFERLADVAQGRAADPQGVALAVHGARGRFRSMLRALRTVRDFERLEAGRIAMADAEVWLGELAREVKAELDWQAAATGKALELEVTPREHAVRGDGDRLREVVHHMTAFALRQPANRSARLRVWSAGGVTRLAASGDGQKIAPEDRERVFEPYETLAGHGALVGAGLGLAFARHVVALHGGALWLEDAGDGTTTLMLELASDGGAASRLRPVAGPVARPVARPIE